MKAPNAGNQKSKIHLNAMEEAFLIFTNIHEILDFFEILSRFTRQIVHSPNLELRLEAIKCAVMGACLLLLRLREGSCRDCCPETSRIDSQQLSFRLAHQVEKIPEGNDGQCEYRRVSKVQTCCSCVKCTR
jgi:hypothetical protein